MDKRNTTSDLLRLIGLMAICVAVAWTVQVVGFGGSTALGRLMWVIAAAAIAGAGLGLLYTSAFAQARHQGREA